MSSALMEQVYKGNYLKVLKGSFDNRRYKLKTEDLSAIIAALAFVGRLPEAEQLFHVHAAELSKPELIQARFYLGISLYRHSQNKSGRKLLIENLRTKSSKPKEIFFIYQGLAFMRYFSNQMQSCQLLVERALNAAIKAQFFYGRILALDMSGHIYASLGEIHKGLERLSQAIQLTNQLGHASLKVSLQVSAATYRAQYGLDGKKSRAVLSRILEQKEFQDSYSQAYLYLELARQYTLNGEFLNADLTLQKAVQNIYKTNHRKQSILLNLRVAELEFQKGNYHKALSAIAVLKNPDLKINKEPGLTEFLNGIEQKIVRALNLSAKIESVHDSRKLNKEDPITKLKLEIMDMQTPQLEIIQKMEELGCLGFLIDFLKLDRNKKYIVMNVLGTKALLYDSRGLILTDIGRSQNIIALIKCLSDTWQNKENLVQKVWGYNYEALRHDAMLFSALQSLRRSFADFSDWILREEQGYRLNPEVEIIDLAPKIKAKLTQRESTFKDHTGLKLDLNYRQLRFLQSEHFISEGIGIREYGDLYKVSNITATRDLSDLNSKGLVARIGKGRATRYIPPETEHL